MSAETLREAAQLMRERANGAPNGEWFVAEGGVWVSHDPDASSSSGMTGRLASWADGGAIHIASWHPAVALAVADWLDHEAETDAFLKAVGARGLADEDPALAVARAYLGESA